MGRYASTFDWVSTILLSCLGLFGLFILLTISRELFLQQLVFIAAGFAIIFVTSRILPGLLWWLGPILYIGSLILLALSYFGPSIRGATRWIFIGGFQLQPSEFVKPLLLIAFARFIAQYPPRKIKYIPLHVVLFLIPFLLVFKQPDLGSSIIYAAMWIAMMLGGGLPIGLLIATVVGGFFLLPVFWNVLLPYQKDRIFTFINPALDPQGAGYNALQAMIAIGSGQLFGRGLGRGTQSHLRFLPEYHTDFLFATLVEELGFFGGMLLLIGYFALLWRIVGPLFRGKMELFPFLYSVGLFSILLTQVFINAGMNMGVIPVTGITLPYVSYGGSSILSVSLSFGLLFAIKKTQEEWGGIAIG